MIALVNGNWNPVITTVSRRLLVSWRPGMGMGVVMRVMVDTNGKGTLDYGEFVPVCPHLQRMANDEHLHKAFSYFDKNNNGYIEPNELRDALMEDGADDCTDVANDIFHEVDTDKDGLINYDEFVAIEQNGSCTGVSHVEESKGGEDSVTVGAFAAGTANIGALFVGAVEFSRG